MRLRRFELPASRLWSHCQSSYSIPETDGGVNKQRADTTSLLEIANDFVNNENRHRNFGKFTLTDRPLIIMVFCEKKYRINC